MGNSLLQQDHLAHVRGWSKDQISGANHLIRRQKRMYSLTKDEFTRYFAGRSREAITVFNALDTDYDGRVDSFEVLVVFTLWSGTSFEEKLSLLFEIFDLMGKGFLKLDALMMLGSVMVTSLKKFATLDQELCKTSFIRNLSQKAVSRGSEQGVTEEQFQAWASGCEQLNALRGFLEDHAIRGQPESLETRMQIRMHMFSKHAARLFDCIELVQDRLPEFTNDCIDFVASLGRRKRWDFTMQNLRQFILTLQKASETMHVALTDLEAEVKEDEVSGGTACMINPERRFRQEQMILELEAVRKESTNQFREFTDLLRRLIELSDPLEPQPGMAAVGLGDDDEMALAMQDLESKNALKKAYEDFHADGEVGGIFGPPAEVYAALMQGQQGDAQAEQQGGNLKSLADEPVKREAMGPKGRMDEHVLIAVAEYEPPSTHETQMLRLKIGDAVTVFGQDGRGWWFGRKLNGKEGWFPPSYVQMKAAHLTAEKQMDAITEPTAVTAS
eukprot:TRINITY_DN25079_c0_g1_i1.p1 TRINITY_DN25079_c0_g1~~TRINITY_DN25079_c0_g1_i1.p1  ORF type:complete len:501 (-),score=110.33 TRINITY_DN25079_c0_g1_i1:169-1671(-)